MDQLGLIDAANYRNWGKVEVAGLNLDLNQGCRSGFRASRDSSLRIVFWKGLEIKT